MGHAVDWAALSMGAPLIDALPTPARRSARMVHLAKDGVLFRSGDEPTALYFVVAGDVRLLRRSTHGDAIVLQRARRGFIAEASLEQPAYRCDAVAAQDTHLLKISRRAFQHALAADGYRALWVSHLTRELHQARALAERLSLKTAEGRILHYIETEGTSGAVRLQVTKKEWAVELGLSHEALYRTLSIMQRRGMIDLRDGAIRAARRNERT